MFAHAPSGGWAAQLPARLSRTRQTRYGFATREAAAAWLDGELARLAAGDEAAAPLLIDWLETWLGRKAATVSPNTLRIYRTAVAKAAPLWHLRLDELTPDAFTDLWAQMKPILPRHGSLPTRHQPASIQSWRRALIVALAAAVPRYLPSNPAAASQIRRVPRRPILAWDAEQRRTFLRAAQGTRLYLAWLLALTLGLRLPSEVQGLRWEDVDWRRRRITIGASKTDAGVRELLLPGPVHDALLAAYEARDPATPWLLPSDRRAGPVGDVAMRAEWRRLVDLTGLPAIRMYAARHVAAATALAGGVPVQQVSRMLGHASPAVTLTRYAGWAESYEDIAIEAIGASLAGAGDASETRPPRP